MIWFEESCTVPNQPSEASVTLRGVYNIPGQSALSIIQIVLYITDGNNEICKTIYEHNPTMLKQEYPDPTDVLARYQAKVNKIIKKVSNTNFDDLVKL